MSGLVDSSRARYAVIEVRRSEGSPERLVIAYTGERSVLELIEEASRR